MFNAFYFINILSEAELYVPEEMVSQTVFWIPPFFTILSQVQFLHSEIHV